MRRWHQQAVTLAAITTLAATLGLGTTIQAQNDTKEQNIDDRYVEVYNTIAGADEAWQMGKKRDAYELYQKAQEALQSIQKDAPDWNKKLVQFRLSYVSAKIEQFAKQAEIEQPAEEKKEETLPNTPNEATLEIQKLRNQVAQLEAVRQSLEARLKEAVSAQPATIDPKQLKKAEQKIDELSKANADLAAMIETLKNPELGTDLTPKNMKRLEAAEDDVVRLETEVAVLKMQNKELKETLDSSTRTAHSLKKAQSEIEKLESEISDLKKQNSELRDSLSNAKARHSKDEKDNIDDLEAEIERLTKQNSELLSSLSDETQMAESLKASEANIKKLEAEIASLKKQNEELKNSTPTENNVAQTNAGDMVLLKQVGALQKQIEELQNQVKKTEQENLELTEKQQAITAQYQEQLDVIDAELTRLRLSNDQKNMDNFVSQPTPATADSDVIKGLQTKLLDLEKTLENLSEENHILRTVATRKGANKAISDIDHLRARIAVYERNKEPYTAEELALMQTGESIRVGDAISKEVEMSTIGVYSAQDIKQVKRGIPQDGQEIADEAVKAFSDGKMEEAERLFQRLLSLDENSVYSLGNLGAAQLELNKLKEAEANLKKAYSLDPQDTYVMNLLAILNLKNQKIDYAFELLCDSAKIDPSNAETQNYLGMVLAERGLRKDAEKAFRSAVRLNPNYPVAHYNLAVLYATSQPAYPRLANYHYRKSIELGASANPAFENMLEKTMSTVAESSETAVPTEVTQ